MTKMRTSKAGQKTQLKADIYPLPHCKFHYEWAILAGENIANVDSKGVLTVSLNAVPGDVFTVKTTAVTEDPFIQPMATIVDYLVQ